MTRSELIGYVRKSNVGNALKITLLKSAFEEAQSVKRQDGTEYVSLIVNLAKIKKIIGDDQEVTSVCQLIEDEIQEKKEETEDAKASSDSPICSDSPCSSRLGDGYCNASGMVCPYPEEESSLICNGELCKMAKGELDQYQEEPPIKINCIHLHYKICNLNNETCYHIRTNTPKTRSKIGSNEYSVCNTAAQFIFHHKEIPITI